MSPLTSALQRYQHLDPAGWLEVAAVLPSVAGIALAALGVVFLLVGGGRMFRFIAAPLGGLVGVVLGPAVLTRFHLPLQPGFSMELMGGLCFLAGLASPVATLFLAGAIPGGLALGELAGSNDYLLGFLPGFLAGGLMVALLARALTGVIASFVGGWLFVLGLLTTMSGTPNLLKFARSQPLAVLALAGVFAVAGSIYQLAIRLTPEELSNRRAQKRDARHRAAAQRETERRWKQYHR